MKLITKTPKKVVLEIKKSKLIEIGFDELWDEVRNSYPHTTYDLFKITNEEKSMFIEFDLKKTEEVAVAEK